MEKKQQQEEEFSNWVASDEERVSKYGDALPLIQTAVQQRSQIESALQYAYECFFTAAEITGFAYQAYLLYVTLQRDPENTSLIDSLKSELIEYGNEFFKNYNVETDMKVVPAIFQLFYDNVNQNFHPGFFAEVEKKYKGDFYKFSQNLFKKSFFTSQEKFNDFLEKPTLKSIEKDPAFMAAVSALELYSNLYYGLMYFDLDYNEGHRKYIAGLMEMNPEKTYYPDANFTMRMSYGTVQDYYPRDAVHYNYITTIEGILEKEDPENWEFVVPDKLKMLFETKDYGPYGINGTMPVCFITNNDITGGNSGSPVINGEGHLIGIAFDGNWEAMSGDIAYEPELQRCISVDIRYILFVIDKFAGASHLIDEMTIIF